MTNSTKKCIAGCVFFCIALCMMFFYIAPAIYPITVEEQAGKKAERPQTVVDELSNKVPERRELQSPTSYRDPRLACLLSLIVPGGGHIYLREDLKGAGFCLLTGASYGTAAYYFYKAYKGDYEDSEKKSKYVIGGLFTMIGAIVHVVGIVEAYNDAVEINEKNFYYGTSHSKTPYIAEIVFE
ncbi:MAG: hypothetical protein N2316_04660 [Spirochaetes bacterium]|nr:hypothetical protein [Spirochaetota bacterium]